MISHKHKCVFVHVPKVAGISIEQIFLDDLGMDYSNRGALLLGVNTNQKIGPPRISHLTAKEYVSLHYISQELFDNYFKFAFVRNPYDRVYSFYCYLGYENIISFEYFVNNILPIEFSSQSLFYFIQPMTNYIFDEQGRNLMDYVGRLENIDSDIKFVYDALALEGVKLGHGNKSVKIGWISRIKRSLRILRRHKSLILFIFSRKRKEKLFTDKMKEVVYELYREDFVNFNYSR